MTKKIDTTSAKIDALSEKFDEISDKVDNIMQYIEGDKRFATPGLAGEHQLLMKAYVKYKPQEKIIDCVLEDHKNRKFLARNFEKIITVVGIGNILTAIVYIYKALTK